jgi:hypothetical protein
MILHILSLTALLWADPLIYFDETPRRFNIDKPSENLSLVPDGVGSEKALRVQGEGQYGQLENPRNSSL